MSQSQSPTSAWRYAIGMFGTSLPINMFLTYMGFYYVTELNVLTSTQIAAVLVAYAIIDAIDNPLYGYLSDRTRTRWGRRRPWLLVGAPLLAIGLVAFFNPPVEAEPPVLLAWFAVFAILVQTIDSLVNTNYGSLLPELFPEERARAKVNGLRQAFMLVAIVISVALTPVITDAIGYPATAVAYGVVAAVVISSVALGARENPARRESRKPRALESIRAILGTKQFWLIAIVSGAYASAMPLVLAGAPFFVTYTLGLDAVWSSVLLGTVILGSIGFLGIWVRIVRRRGALAVWRIALVILAVSFVPMYLVETLPLAIAAGLVVAVGYSGVIATMDLVVARFIDADAARTGLHREGMTISAFGFANRLNALARSAAFFGMAAFYGFNSASDPGDNPGDAARFLMLVVPFVLVVVAAVVSRFVRLDRPAPDAPSAPATAVVGA